MALEDVLITILQRPRRIDPGWRVLRGPASRPAGGSVYLLLDPEGQTVARGSRRAIRKRVAALRLADPNTRVEMEPTTE